MKNVFSMLFLLILCLPFFGQDAAKDAADKVKKIAGDFSITTAAEPPTMTVRGRVFYEETGQPLRRSWIGFVKIREVNPGSEAENKPAILNSWEFQNTDSVLTNDFGEFVMKDVAPGVYQAVMKVPGILNPTAADRESPVFQQFVFDGINEAQVEIGVKRGGSISGRVLYQDGAPLIGAAVTLYSVKQATPETVDIDLVEPTLEEIANIGAAQTDDRGYYRFAGVPQGEYVVMVAEPSVFDGSNSKVSSYSTYKYFSTSELKTFYPNAASKAEASKLQVFLGEEIQNVDITLAPRELFEVVGRVVGEGTNALVDEIEVQFTKEGDEESSDYQALQIRTTTTDKEGVWRFKDMLPGKYIAKVSEPSYRRYRDETEEPLTRPNYATSEHRFEIIPDEKKDVILRIAVEGTVSGTMTVEGNAELPDTITIYADTKTERVSSDSPETTDYEEDEARQMVTTKFTVDDLAAGEYYLSVSASDGYFAKSITVGGKDVMNQPLSIKAGEAVGNVRVLLSSGSGTVKGKVMNAAESDYLYASIMPVRSDISLYRAYLLGDSDYIGDDRTFEMQARPGEYYLFVRPGIENLPKKGSPPEKFDTWVRELIKSAVKIRLVRGKTVEADISKPQ